MADNVTDRFQGEAYYEPGPTHIHDQSGQPGDEPVLLFSGNR